MIPREGRRENLNNGQDRGAGQWSIHEQRKMDSPVGMT